MRVSNLVLPDIRETLRAKPGELADALRDFHPADLAEVITELSDEEALVLLSHVPQETVGETFDYLDPGRRLALFSSLPIEIAAATAERMAADERADLFGQLPPPLRATLLGRMRPEDSREVTRLLKYPPTSAGGIMTTEYLAFPANLTAAEVLHQIRLAAQETESIYTVYLTDPHDSRLVGVVSLRDVLVAEPDRPAGELMVENVIKVTPDTDQEEVAHLISKYDLLQVPVVDAHDAVVGIVTVDDVIDVLADENTEDIHRIAAVSPTEEPYLASSFPDLIRRRAGWLSVLFIGEMLTATAMSYFQYEIEQAVVLALFIPLIISSGGNSGAQATSLIIRALAVGDVNPRHWSRVLRRELAAGITLGALLGLIAFIRIMFSPNPRLAYGDHYTLLALTVAASLVGVVLWGTCIGSMLPFLLRRVGFDPAAASAPLVATLVDVTGIVIYFSTAMLLLHGVLL